MWRSRLVILHGYGSHEAGTMPFLGSMDKYFVYRHMTDVGLVQLKTIVRIVMLIRLMALRSFS